MIYLFILTLFFFVFFCWPNSSSPILPNFILPCLGTSCKVLNRQPGERLQVCVLHPLQWESLQVASILQPFPLEKDKQTNKKILFEHLRGVLRTLKVYSLLWKPNGHPILDTTNTHSSVLQQHEAFWRLNLCWSRMVTTASTSMLMPGDPQGWRRAWRLEQEQWLGWNPHSCYAADQQVVWTLLWGDFARNREVACKLWDLLLLQTLLPRKCLRL